MRILIIIAACVGLYFILRYLFCENPKKFTRHFFFALIGLFTLLLFVLAIIGRLHWLFVLLAALLPWLRRLLRLAPLVRMARSSFGLGGMRFMGAQPKPGQSSNVHSQFFNMTLNHDSGEISGKVMKGEFSGNTLEQLSSRQLKRLLAECRADNASHALLCSYLNYRFGSDWQTEFDDAEQTDEASGDANDEAMTYEEALDILGLKDPIGKKDIITAHRSMMQKFHPDRGGSNYLAAKINEAKDYLLHYLED